MYIFIEFVFPCTITHSKPSL